MAEVAIYTDGACRGNPGLGGWGAVLKSGKHYKEIYGGDVETTNNQMELTAAIKALQSLKHSDNKIKLYTDSVYVKNGITDWLENWKARGWKTASKKAVKNIELWQQLDEINRQHDVEWCWVKGHAGDEGNEKADQLANKAIDEIIEQSK